MAHDYAAAIVQEFGGPVDVIGTSTGGPIAKQFARDVLAFLCELGKEL